MFKLRNKQRGGFKEGRSIPILLDDQALGNVAGDYSVVDIVTAFRSPKVLSTDRGNTIDQRDAYPARKVSKSWYQQQCLDKTVIHSYIALAHVSTILIQTK